MKPYVVHTTFQYGGSSGKRHRLRESMLWVDPPAYYSGAPVHACVQFALRLLLGCQSLHVCLPCELAPSARRRWPRGWLVGPPPGRQPEAATRCVDACAMRLRPMAAAPTHRHGLPACLALGGPAEGRFLSVELQYPDNPADYQEQDKVLFCGTHSCGVAPVLLLLLLLLRGGAPVPVGSGACSHAVLRPVACNPQARLLYQCALRSSLCCPPPRAVHDGGAALQDELEGGCND